MGIGAGSYYGNLLPITPRGSIYGGWWIPSTTRGENTLQLVLVE